MTNYPQKPNSEAARAPQGPGQRGPGASDSASNRGVGDNPLADPGIRMVLSMSPQDGSIKQLPENLNFEQQQNGSVRVSFPDGSYRELIPGLPGEGRMVTTLIDGTRIQSDLTFGEGQVSVSSISSTGEKTLLSLNENGANMQRVTADGQISNFIPENASELVQSYREAEAFAQAEELREQEDFQGNQEFSDWNNYGKPADWQPEQSWQPEQNWQPQPNFTPQFDQGFNQPAAYMPQPNFTPQFDQGFNQPAAYMPQPNFTPQFDQGFNQPAAYMPQPNFTPQFDQGFNQPAAYMPPQNFGNGFMQPGAAFGLDPQPEPPHTMMGGSWQPQQNWQSPATFMSSGGEALSQSFAGEMSSGFAPPPPTDPSGFPLAPNSGAYQTTSAMMNSIGENSGTSSGEGIIENVGLVEENPEGAVNQESPQF